MQLTATLEPQVISKLMQDVRNDAELNKKLETLLNFKSELEYLDRVVAPILMDMIRTLVNQKGSGGQFTIREAVDYQLHAKGESNASEEIKEKLRNHLYVRLYDLGMLKVLYRGEDVVDTVYTLRSPQSVQPFEEPYHLSQAFK